MLKIRSKLQSFIHMVKQKVNSMVIQLKSQRISTLTVLTDNRGESNSVGSAVGIVMSVVLGLFLLNKLLELFGVNIMPAIQTKIGEMFGKV
jgi:hypothetical protein